MLVSAWRVVTTKNVVHAALYLVIVLAGVAAQFILLGAEFIGVTQVLVYIGAIIVLFLFGIMLTRARLGDDESVGRERRLMAALVGVVLFGVMASALIADFEDTHVDIAAPSTTAAGQRLDLLAVPHPVRGRAACCCSPRSSAPSSWLGRTETPMLLNQFLLLAAVLFCIGVYGVLARRNGVLVLMSVELILNAVNINLVVFGAFRDNIAGEVFALFVIAIAAAEVGVGLAHGPAPLPQPQEHRPH